jgi:hypothetical protein
MACGQLYGVRVTGPEMRRVGSKTRAGRQHGDGAVERLAVDTLRTAFGGERASAGFERERREWKVLGKLGPAAGSEGLEESNPRRGAAGSVVNNCVASNAASCG